MTAVPPADDQDPFKSDPIRDGLQRTVGEGWFVTHYVCVAAFQRVDPDGNIQHGNPVLYTGMQPQYVTEGLSYCLDDLIRQEYATESSDDD
jgi:hypothetical protein